MTQQKPIIGCLALQGAVELHRPHVEACGATFKAVKTPAQFEEVDGFILPGGESTTMLKLIERFDLWDVLAKQFAKKPVWGICAGSILMAETVLVSLPSSSRWRASSEALAPPLSRGQAWLRLLAMTKIRWSEGYSGLVRFLQIADLAFKWGFIFCNIL